jgi:small redox-active disulfide protein 2
MKIEVFAAGCSKCRLIEVATHAALDELGLTTEVEKIDTAEAQKRGLMSQPALFINGKLMVEGRVPMVSEIKDMINQQKGLITDISVV